MAGLGKDAATLEQHQQWTEAPRTSEDSPPTTAQTATAGWTLTQRDTAAAHQQPVLTTRMGLHHAGPNFVRTLVIPVFIQDRSAEEDPDPTPGRIKSPRGSRQTVCRALCGLAQQVGDTGQVGRSTAPVPPAAPRQQAGDTGQVGRSTAPGRRWHLANRSGTLGKLAGQLPRAAGGTSPTDRGHWASWQGNCKTDQLRRILIRPGPHQVVPRDPPNSVQGTVRAEEGHGLSRTGNIL